VLNLNLLTTKTHYLAQNHVVWCIKRENRSNGLVCGARKNWKSAVNIRRFWAISHIWGQNPWADWPLIFWWYTSPT